MALIIRMRQQGAKGNQQFRIVVTNVRSPRDGKYVEKLGWYNPVGGEGKNFLLNMERLQYWLGVGARLSDKVRSLVSQAAPEVVQQETQKQVRKRTKKREQRKKRSAKKTA